MTSNIILYHLYVELLVKFSFNLTHIFIYRIRFAKASRVEDFNSRDIYSPERERTLMVLSAFINFVKFTEQYCDAFLKDLRDRSDTLIVRREDVTARLKEIQDKVDELT
jgi:kinetochore protein Nuf2